MATHVFYIHGFNSSPQSAKARLTGEYLARHHPDVEYRVPALPYDPEKAVALLCAAVEARLPDRICLIGSSLGGFYGAWLAERYNLPLVLVNPAVHAHDLLVDYLGEQQNLYTGERYVFTREHIGVLRALDVPVTRPERYWLLTQTGDEVLDYRQGVARFAACRQRVEPGGSHGFDGFEHHLPDICTFWGLAPGVP